MKIYVKNPSLTTKQAADFVKKNKSALYRWIKAGSLPHIKIKGKIVIDSEDLNVFVKTYCSERKSGKTRCTTTQTAIANHSLKTEKAENEWRYKMGEKYSATQDEWISAKISDWDNAENCAHCGAPIVHIWWAKTKENKTLPFGKSCYLYLLANSWSYE